MNKYLLSAIISCIALLSTAKEYVFDLRDISIPTTGNTLEMTSDDGEITFTITIPETDVADYGTPQRIYSMEDCVFDPQTGRLKVIWGKGASVRITQNMGRNLNYVCLGEWIKAADGTNFNFSNYPMNGDRSTHVWDCIPNGNEQKMWALNQFNLKDKQDKTELYSDIISWYANTEIWIGPTFIVRDERTSLEDLTFADHAVKDFKHEITDDLVGVIAEEVTGGVGKMLFCRSAEPISSNHKHAPKPGQQLWNRHGEVPSYADPETPQFAWIALRVDDPDQYVGKRFNNVQGLYCPHEGRENGHYFGWHNPNMTVESTPNIVGDAETAVNTYCVANFSEQDDQHYFFMEPRPCEVCNVVEAMRTGNDVVLAPTSDAITPDGNEDYVDDNIAGGTAFFNNYGLGLPPYGPQGNGMYAYLEVDQEYMQGDNDYPTHYAPRSYFKLFNFTNLIATCFSDNQFADTHYYFPLDTPNFYYDQDEPDIILGLMGTGNTHTVPSGPYNEDFFVGFSDYYSRYDWHRDVNVYKNDMRISLIEHPYDGDEHLANFGDIDLKRCDVNGQPIALVATLECQSPGIYKVVYNTASQTAINNGEVDPMLIENGHVLGQPVVDNQIFDLTAPPADDPDALPAIHFSDCFLSETMLTHSSIMNMNSDYTYRLYTHNNGQEIHVILSHVPVYLTEYNEVWRANLTKEQVDADLNGELALTQDLHIKFSSNHDNHVLTYHLMEGDNDNEEHEIGEIGNTHHGDGEGSGIVSPGDDGYEYYDQHENNGVIGWDGLWFVPVIESDHNNNTYGCYKETIDRAYVHLERDQVPPNKKLGISDKEVTDNDGAHYRYFHASLHLWSRQEIRENANPEERYLYRVWREVKPRNSANQAPRLLNDNETTSNRVLLNAEPEFDRSNITQDEFLYWLTDYAGLQEFTGDEIKVSDTFLNEVPADPNELNNFILDVEYHAVLYIHDTVEGLYYPVSSEVIPITWNLSDSSVVTGINSIDADNKTIANVEFYNVAGQRLASPKGITIVVTRFTDGSSISTKQIFK